MGIKRMLRGIGGRPSVREDASSVSNCVAFKAWGMSLWFLLIRPQKGENVKQLPCMNPCCSDSESRSIHKEFSFKHGKRKSCCCHVAESFSEEYNHWHQWALMRFPHHQQCCSTAVGAIGESLKRGWVRKPTYWLWEKLWGHRLLTLL